MSKKRRSIEELRGLELETIQLRLSASDLVRCKQVCKSWRSLISSNYFVTAHLDRSKSDPCSQKLLLGDIGFFIGLPGPFESRTPGLFKSSVIFSADCMFIVGSVNGLICFWWDAAAAVYKVAKNFSYTNGTTMVDIWDSSFPDTWTTVNATAPIYLCESCYNWVHACDVLIEGVAAYWLVPNRRRRMFVLSLDLKTLLLKSIPLPEPLMHDNLYLFGYLVLLHQRSNSPTGMYHVWTMVTHVDGNGTQGWNKSFKICFDFPFEECIGIMNGKLVFKSTDKIITLFDLEITRTQQVLEKDPQLNNIIFMSGAHGFVGSLVSIDGFGFECNDRLKLVRCVFF